MKRTILVHIIVCFSVGYALGYMFGWPGVALAAIFGFNSNRLFNALGWKEQFHK